MLCPICKKQRRVKEFTRTDKKSKKRYFLQQCISCNHTFGIKEIVSALHPFDNA